MIKPNLSRPHNLLRVEDLERLYELNNQHSEKILSELNYRKSDRSKRLATKIKLRSSFKNMTNNKKYYRDKRFNVKDKSLLDIGVIAMNFSARTSNCLRDKGIETLRDITKLTKRELLKIPNLGKGSLAEIEDKLESLFNGDTLGYEKLNQKNPWKLNDSLILDNSIDQLYFSVRTSNCLNSANIETVKDLVNFGRSKLLKLPNFGKNSLKEVEQGLSEFSLKGKGIKLNDLEPNRRINNAQTRFTSNERHNQILVEWNTTTSTLGVIGKKHGITKQYVRLILNKAKKFDLEVVDSHIKLAKRKIESKDKLILEYGDKFLDLYKNFKNNNSEIAANLGLSVSQVNKLKEILLKEKKISRPLLVHRKKNAEPYIANRRKEVFRLKGQQLTINEISSILGVGGGTILNDIRAMKIKGIQVPFTRETGNFLSEETIQYRSNYIETKIELGWTKQEIAEGLGLSSSHSINRHITLYLDEQY